MDAATGIEYLKLHSSQVHGVSSKPEKPRKPVLKITDNCVDMWSGKPFIHKFSIYKSLSRHSVDAASHLLDCQSKEVCKVLLVPMERV